MIKYINDDIINIISKYTCINNLFDTCKELYKLKNIY